MGALEFKREDLNSTYEHTASPWMTGGSIIQKCCTSCGVRADTA